MGRFALVLRVFVVASALSGTAAASPQWRLIYIREAGAASCPEEMELRLAVAARLGRDPFSSGAMRVVVARIGSKRDDLTGSVELIDEAGISRGRREISSAAAKCDELAHAVAISISIAIDPEHVAPEGPAVPPPNATPAFRAPAPALTAPRDVPAAARAVLKRFDERAAHYEVIDRREQ